MDVKALSELAKEKGYRLTKAQPGNRLLLLEKATGKTAGSYSTVEELEEGLEALPVSTPRTPAPSKPVEWTAISQAPPAIRKQCSNGGGSDCLCLTNDPDAGDVTIWCIVSGCDWPAKCNGACSAHFGHARLFGDLTKRAVQLTGEMWAIDPETECSHGRGFHGAEATQARWDAGIRQRVVSTKWMNNTDKNSAGVSAKIINNLLDQVGIIGVGIRPVGNGYSIIDKDGNVLGYNEDPKALVREFLIEES